MKRLIHILLLTLCACSAAPEERDGLTIRSWRSLQDRDISRLGRDMMRGGTRSWIHAESAHFTYHAATRERLERVAREAEWVYAEVSRRLGLPPASERAHVFVVENGQDWERVMSASGRRGDGIALHVGREIFILRDQHAGTTYVDIPHELVHLRLWQEYGHEVPLWLEEGLAVYLGWEVAMAYQETRNLKLYRGQPAITDENWMPWSEVFEATQYPDDPARTAAYYRQTGRLIEQLSAELGAAELGRVMEQLVRDSLPLPELLMTRYDYDEGQVRKLKDTVEQAVKHPVVRVR